MDTGQKAKAWETFMRTLELWYLLASIFAVPILTVIYGNWLSLFFGLQFLIWQFACYWWRREAWKAQRRLGEKK